LLRPDLKIPPAVVQAQQASGLAAIKRLEVRLSPAIVYCTYRPV
jgi:hypothetical protein